MPALRCDDHGGMVHSMPSGAQIRRTHISCLVTSMGRQIIALVVLDRVDRNEHPWRPCERGRVCRNDVNVCHGLLLCASIHVNHIHTFRRNVAGGARRGSNKRGEPLQQGILGICMGSFVVGWGRRYQATGFRVP
eukprot:14037916-Heterocapsa_arctica.AAC.1